MSERRSFTNLLHGPRHPQNREILSARRLPTLELNLSESHSFTRKRGFDGRNDRPSIQIAVGKYFAMISGVLLRRGATTLAVKKTAYPMALRGMAGQAQSQTSAVSQMMLFPVECVPIKALPSSRFGDSSPLIGIQCRFLRASK